MSGPVVLKIDIHAQQEIKQKYKLITKLTKNKQNKQTNTQYVYTRL